MKHLCYGLLLRGCLMVLYLNANVVVLENKRAFDGIVKRHASVVIKLYTPWCRGVDKIAYPFACLSNDPSFLHVCFAEANVDACHLLELFCHAQGVCGFPAFFFVRDGTIVYIMQGTRTHYASVLCPLIERYLPKKCVADK